MSIPFTCLSGQKNTYRPAGTVRGILHLCATVQALASQGGEIALCSALVSTKPVQTSAGCLHPFAAAIHIPVVALPTGYKFILAYHRCLVNRKDCFLWTVTRRAPVRNVFYTLLGWHIQGLFLFHMRNSSYSVSFDNSSLVNRLSLCWCV